MTEQQFNDLNEARRIVVRGMGEIAGFGPDFSKANAVLRYIDSLRRPFLEAMLADPGDGLPSTADLDAVAAETAAAAVTIGEAK